LRAVLEPFTEVCQVSAFTSNTFVVLAYSEPNDTYTLLGVHCKEARFSKIDTIRFKRGQVVHGFTLIDTS